MSKQASFNPTTLDKSEVQDVKFGKGTPMYYSGIATQVSFLQGKVLTVIDAAIADHQQNKAIKDLIKTAFGEQLDWMFELCGRPFDELSEAVSLSTPASSK